MSAHAKQGALELAVLLVACRDLPGAFGTDPFAWLSPAALAIWLLGVACGARRRAAGPERLVALVLSALAGLLAVRVIAHVALAVWIVGALRAPWRAVPAALCWMPALGAACVSIGPDATGALRLTIALLWLAWCSRAR